MSGDLEFSIGEVAAMLGMTPSTVRVWERRYKAVAPRRTGGGQRRYSVDDIAELHRVKSLAASRGRSVRLAALETQGVGGLPSGSSTTTVAGSPAMSLLPWAAVADLLSSLLLVLTDVGVVADANRAVVNAFGDADKGVAGRRFTDLVDPHDRAKAVRLYRAPRVERRGWEVNLRTSPPRTYSFDSWLVGEPAGASILLVGQPVQCASSPSDHEAGSDEDS